MRVHGVVMKITDECIVVLCSDGTFRNLPRPAVPPRLGETIPVPDAAVRPSSRAARWRRLLRSGYGAAAAFLLLFGLAAWYFGISGMPGQPAAIVAVDINPGVELYVDRSGKVDKAVPVNDDATLLLANVPMVGKELHEAVRLVILAAEAQGIWNETPGKRWIWIAVVPFKGAPPQLDPARIAPDNRNYEIELFTADVQQMNEAKKSGLTLNKYIVYEQARQRGIELDLSDLQALSITASLTRTGIQPEMLFGSAEGAGAEAEDDTGNRTVADSSAETADRDDATDKSGTDARKDGAAGPEAKGGNDRTAPSGADRKPNGQAKNRNGDARPPSAGLRDRAPATGDQAPGWMHDTMVLRFADIVETLKERANGKRPDGQDRNRGRDGWNNWMVHDPNGWNSRKDRDPDGWHNRPVRDPDSGKDRDDRWRVGSDERGVQKGKRDDAGRIDKNRNDRDLNLPKRDDRKPGDDRDRDGNDRDRGDGRNRRDGSDRRG